MKKRFPSWLQILVALVFTVSAGLAGAEDRCAQVSAPSNTSGRLVVSSTQISQRDMQRLSDAKIATGNRLVDALATDLGPVELEDFETKTRIVVEADGLEYEAFSLLEVQGTSFRGALVFSPLPTVIREKLAMQQQDIPWSVMTVASGPTANSIILGMSGHGAPQVFTMAEDGAVDTTTAKPVQTDISEGCVGCIKGLLKDAGCEAVAIAVSCATGIGCPGSIMAALVKMTIGETTSITCSQLSILGCAAQCSAPTISITPASNSTLAPSTVQIRVSVSGGTQLGNWVAVLKGAVPQYVSVRVGANGVYEWVAAPGTYRILAGNIPGVSLSFPPSVGMPWIKSSANVVITNPNASPTANFTFTTSGLTARFTDSSTDSDGTIASRKWNFGDGSTSTSTNPSKTYASAGTRSVSLTVTDNGGKSNTISKSVTVSQQTACSDSLFGGYLSEGRAAVQPNGNYYTANRAGTHSGRLTGPAGVDFDLFLYRWNGTAWSKVASSRGASSTEQITYSGAAGYYYWLIAAYRGSGNYSLCAKQP